MKRLVTLIAGAILAIGLAKMPAQAATIHLDPSPTDSGSFFQFEQHHGSIFSLSNFTDSSLKFTLSDAADVTLNLAGLGIQGLKFSLNGGAFTSVAGNILLSGGSFDLGNLVASTSAYVITFKGKVSLFSGSLFGSVVAVAATPIPPALLMFLTALGGLGFVGWRRHQATLA
jgi:hypothetical protein